MTKRKYAAIHFYVFYSNQVNPAYVIDLQLMKDDGPSYTYDSQGNLNTAKKTQEKDSFHYSRKDLLSRMTQADGSAYEYGYDGKRLLKTAKSTEGIQSEFTYNAKGLPAAARIHGGKTAARRYAGRGRGSCMG